MLGVYVHAKPVLGKDLHELQGDFLLDPDDLPTGGGSEHGGGGSGGGGGGGGGGGSRSNTVFYADGSGESEVSCERLVARIPQGTPMEVHHGKSWIRYRQVMFLPVRGLMFYTLAISTFIFNPPG